MEEKEEGGGRSVRGEGTREQQSDALKGFGDDAWSKASCEGRGDDSSDCPQLMVDSGYTTAGADTDADMDCTHGDPDSGSIGGEQEVVSEGQKEAAAAEEEEEEEGGVDVKEEEEEEAGIHQNDESVVKNQSTDESAEAGADQLLGGASSILHIDPPACASSSSSSSSLTSLSVPVPLTQEHPSNLSQQFDAHHSSPHERHANDAIGGSIGSVLLPMISNEDAVSYPCQLVPGPRTHSRSRSREDSRVQHSEQRGDQSGEESRGYEHIDKEQERKKGVGDSEGDGKGRGERMVYIRARGGRM